MNSNNNRQARKKGSTSYFILFLHLLQLSSLFSLLLSLKIDGDGDKFPCCWMNASTVRTKGVSMTSKKEKENRSESDCQNNNNIKEIQGKDGKDIKREREKERERKRERWGCSSFCLLILFFSPDLTLVFQVMSRHDKLTLSRWKSTNNNRRERN